MSRDYGMPIHGQVLSVSPSNLDLSMSINGTRMVVVIPRDLIKDSWKSDDGDWLIVSAEYWQKIERQLDGDVWAYEIAAASMEWQCPIHMKGCKHNCGSYVCGN